MDTSFPVSLPCVSTVAKLLNFPPGSNTSYSNVMMSSSAVRSSSAWWRPYSWWSTRNRAILAMSLFFLVRCSLMIALGTSCFSRAVLCFQLLNLMIIAGLSLFPRLWSGWHASTGHSLALSPSTRWTHLFLRGLYLAGWRLTGHTGPCRHAGVRTGLDT